MLVRSQLRRRLSISFAFLTAIPLAALLFAAAVPSALNAQTTSAAISSLRPVAQQDRVPAHPNFAQLTQLSHQLPGWVHGRAQSAAHAVDLSATIHVSLVLARDPAVEAAFSKFLADQQTPGSPLYHQWLTPQQVGSLYGPTANDLAALTSWLTSQGLKLDSIAPSGVIVHASGSAAVVGNAFHTSFAMFDPNAGFTAAPRLSAVSEPSIPSALTPLVRSIQGLGELELRPLSRARAVQGAPRSAASTPSAGVEPLITLSATEHFVTPGDFDIIFDLNSVLNGGNTGATVGSKAQRVAVIGESRVTTTDISEYESLTGLPATTPTVVIPTGDTDPGTTGTGLQSEATLDVDRVIATAPGAGVDLVIAKETSTGGGIFDAAEWNVSNLLDPIMTISFGGCESENGLSAVTFVDALAQDAAAEGITTLVSSGDSGAAGCDTSFVAAPATQVASINFICSSTYVTCVGGTEFNDTANPATYWSSSNSSTYVSVLSYIPEGGWNEPGPNSSSPVYAPAASGGGVSSYIDKPTWQTGTGVPSGNFRLVPDVAFPAAEHDGYFACLAFAKGDCTVVNNSFSFIIFSGTSAAAPGMAGVVALINTKTGTSAGNINPLLYALAASTPSAFHDTTTATSGVTGCAATTPSMCNNSTPGPSTLTGGLAGYVLTTGYDEVTGLGSMDVANLITAAAAVPTFVLTSSPTSLSATPTASTSGSPISGTVTSAITATSKNGFTGAVSLSCVILPTVTGPPTCGVSTTSGTLTANGTATATLTVTFQGTTSSCTTNSAATPASIHTAILGPVAFALLLLLLPFRKRSSIRNLACLLILVTGLASLTGCGGSASNPGQTCNVVGAGTTAGSYTVIVTGTSGSTTTTTTVPLTIN